MFNVSIGRNSHKRIFTKTIRKQTFLMIEGVLIVEKRKPKQRH